MENIDLTVDPPPDLVVEVDISSDSKQRLMTYAALRVPEVWRYNRGSFMVLTLTDGNYTESSASRIASGLPASEIAQRIEIDYQTKGETTLAIRAKWQQWLREIVTFTRARSVRPRLDPFARSNRCTATIRSCCRR
jgi:hypothetical protein